MQTDRFPLWGIPRDVAILAGATLLAMAAALVAWTRLERLETSTLRKSQEYPRIVSGAERLVSLRAELGDRADTDHAADLDLIPFLEMVATRAGIPREAMSLSSDDPRPVAGRPDLVEQETRVDLKAVSAPGLIQLLSAAEQKSSALQVREIVMTPFSENRDWTARVRFVLVQPAAGKR